MIPRSKWFGGILPFIGFTTFDIPHRCDDPFCNTVALRLEGFALAWFHKYFFIRVTITPLGVESVSSF